MSAELTPVCELTGLAGKPVDGLGQLGGLKIDFKTLTFADIEELTEEFGFDLMAPPSPLPDGFDLIKWSLHVYWRLLRRVEPEATLDEAKTRFEMGWIEPLNKLYALQLFDVDIDNLPDDEEPEEKGGPTPAPSPTRTSIVGSDAATLP